MKKLDYYAIGIYLSIGLTIAFAYYFKVLSQEKINTGLLLFGLAGSLLLYGFYYNRLRNLMITLIWSIISLFQIIIYFVTKSNTDFNNAIEGTYLSSLFYLPLLLIIFQMLRFCYKLIYKQELIISLRRYSLGEIVENRKVGWTDIIFSIIGMMLIIFGLDAVEVLLKN